MLNPDLISVFLENYHEFNESGDSDSRLFLMDIHTAIYNAPLTTTERSIVQRLFIDQPEAPARGKLDKDGFSRGRPAGGTTQQMLCEQLGIEKSTLSNIKRSAIEKMATYLGDEYDLD
jgi:hypothetical protein